MDDRIELVGGVEQRTIQIVDHDPAWPRRFAQERDRIASALGATARRIDHIGSTAVPGLAAKPIVDLQVSVPDVDYQAACLDRLLAAGYQLRVREPGTSWCAPLSSTSTCTSAVPEAIGSAGTCCSVTSCAAMPMIATRMAGSSAILRNGNGLT